MSSITIPRKRYEKMMELLKENHELKEEIKELKFENEEYIWLGTSTHFGIENDKLKEENQELKKKQLAQGEVNGFLMKKFKDITTEQSLAEMVGLGKDTGTEIAMVHIAEEFLKSVKI